MIFQWGSTLKVSIELPVTSRHRRDMTERLLKATLSLNQTNKQFFFFFFLNQGPVVQSIVSLMSSSVVKMLTVLISTISNSQVFLLKKMWVAFANAKATHIFFRKNIIIYAIFNDHICHILYFFIFNDQNFNDTVTHEQLGSDCFLLMYLSYC